MDGDRIAVTFEEGPQGTYSYELFYFFDVQKPSSKMACNNETPVHTRIWT
jgi:hypothetical protein